MSRRDLGVNLRGLRIAGVPLAKGLLMWAGFEVQRVVMRRLDKWGSRVL